MGPFNTFLAVLIILQNSLLLAHISDQGTSNPSVGRPAARRGPFTTLFMIIAALDIVVAVGEVIRATTALVCLSDSHVIMPTWFIVSHVIPGMFGYTCSVFCTVVVTVAMTTLTVNPYRRINNRTVYIVVGSGIAFWAAISVANFVVFYRLIYGPDGGSCELQWEQMIFTDLGEPLAIILVQYLRKLEVVSDNYFVIINSPLFLSFGVPCLILVVCMTIQMVFMKKNLSGTTSQHVSVTILMVSLLYVVCNGASVVYSIVGLCISGKKLKN